MEEDFSTEIFYSLFCFVFSTCIIYPPVEFISAGVTIPIIFSFLLGSETEQFVQYHIRRSSVTLFVYAALPLGYFFGLWFLGYRQEFELLSNLGGTSFRQVFSTIALILPLAALSLILNWSRDNWKYHPIAINIAKFCNNNADWMSVASDINIEYRRTNNIQIQSNAVCKVVATENWIIKVMPLSMCIAHQSDGTLEVNHSDMHYFSSNSPEPIQYLNIQVTSSREKVNTFTIRLDAQDFQDFQNHVSRVITIHPSVSYPKGLLERFIEVFSEAILENPRFSIDEPLDNCYGCLETVANIKLQKLCKGNEEGEDRCVTCYCRPIWCASCMAQWFALRQDQDHQETWLSSKCTCPMCRATFCMLDVCLIDQEFIS